MRVALLHDWLMRYGGAERVLSVFHRMFPDAPIYFLFARDDLVERHFPDAQVRGSFLGKTPGFFKWTRQAFLPFYPSAVESIDLSEFDLVISSCSTFIKGVVTRPKTTHVSYVHTPPRFLWDWAAEYQETLSPIKRFISSPLFHYMRIWDHSASMRPDYLIANSRTTRARIKKYYRRDATVIYPPVNLANTHKSVTNFTNRDGYFLIVSQLVSYKRIDLAVRACNELEYPLVVIGEGPERKRLKALAGPTVTFLGWQADEMVAGYYQNARAVLFPGEDDFGIVPVEAMGFGKPVLAFRRGGATETVVEGVTGEFFDEPTVESLKKGLEILASRLGRYDPSVIQKRAEEFSEERFEKEIQAFIDKATGV